MAPLPHNPRRRDVAIPALVLVFRFSFIAIIRIYTTILIIILNLRNIFAAHYQVRSTFGEAIAKITK